MGNEKKYYGAILQRLKEEFSAFIESENLEFMVLGQVDTLLTEGLIKEVTAAGLNKTEIWNYINSLGQLNIDFFLLVINPRNSKFEIVLGEVKDIPALGLKEYSQLIGYCLCSRSIYGLLINVNGGASKNLADLLLLDEDLSKINRRTVDGRTIEHNFGVFKWDSVSQQMVSQNLGSIKSISEMTMMIIDKLK